jgi:hypothetical protein
MLAVMGAGLVISACGNSGGNDLDPYLCTLDDLGGDYQQLTNGNFSPRDLADLGPDADKREREFRDSGMKRGRFVFFKQTLPKPPFEPPLNVVCQVIEFRSREQAQAWVASLQSNHDKAATSVLGWLPRENRDVRPQQIDTEGLMFPDAYSIGAGADDTAVTAKMVVGFSGRYVVSQIVGVASPNADHARLSRTLGQLAFNRLCRLQAVPVTPAVCPSSAEASP